MVQGNDNHSKSPIGPVEATPGDSNARRGVMTIVAFTAGGMVVGYLVLSVLLCWLQDRVAKSADSVPAAALGGAAGLLIGTAYRILVGSKVTGFTRRRWRFGLRALLAAVMVLGLSTGWLVYQRQVVRERRAMLRWIEKTELAMAASSARAGNEMWVNDGASVPWTRRLLGDFPICVIQITKGTLEQQTDGSMRFFPVLEARKAGEIAELFPEAVWKVNDMELVRPDPKMTSYPETGLPTARKPAD